MVRGKMIYVPKVVIDEIEEIKMEDGINKMGFALEKMVKYSKVGREANHLYQWDIWRNRKVR